MDYKEDKEDLPLSVMEVGDGQSTPNESTTSENRSAYGEEGGPVAGTGSGSSHFSSREKRQISCSTHTAVMEEDNIKNLHPRDNGTIWNDLAYNDSLHERFDDITKISQGSFGQVMKGRQKQEGRYYAIKIVPLRKNDEKMIIKEVEALECLKHENIVCCNASWWGKIEVSSSDGSEEDTAPISDSLECNSSSINDRCRGPESCLFIQMELCKMSLEDWIWKRNDNPTENVNKDQSLQICIQIIDGVNHIHSKGFIHRDLKPANILLMEDMTVKIGDFGLVTRVTGEDESHQQQRTLGVGTLTYMAPEQEQYHYESEVDIFASGLIWFEVRWRFGTRQEKSKTWKTIRDGDLPTEFVTEYPSEACEIKKMLSQNPKMRPNAGPCPSSSCHRGKVTETAFTGKILRPRLLLTRSDGQL